MLDEIFAEMESSVPGWIFSGEPEAGSDLQQKGGKNFSL